MKDKTYRSPSYLKAVLLVMLLSPVALAQTQNATDIGVPAESKPGQFTTSTYSFDNIETVNLANGNLSLHIPLVTVGGRGSASYSIALSYNGKVWSPHRETEPGNPDPQFNYPNFHHWSATFDDIIMREPGVLSLGSGWSVVPGPSLKAKKVEIGPIYSATQCGPMQEDGGPNCGYQWVLTKLWLMLPDGSQVELRDNLTDGAPSRTPVVDGYGHHASIDRDRGRVWHSTDGSGIVFVSDGPVYETGQMDGWLFYPDGTRMRMWGPTGLCVKMIDRNGNYLTFDGSTYTDELGRQVTIAVNETTLTITAKGYNGIADRVITADLAMIGALDGYGVPSNLRSDFRSLQRPFYSGDYFRQRDQEDWPHTDPLPHTDLFNGSENTDPVDQHVALTVLHLPDGRSFRFRYNQYGEVAEIVYPGGGVSQIDYVGTMSGLCEGGPGNLRGTLLRKVSETRRSTNGTTFELKTLYGDASAIIDGVSYPTVTMEKRDLTASSSLLSSETHYFLARNSEYRAFSTCDGTGYERWQNAKEFRVDRQTGNGTVTVKRTWEQRGSVAWPNDEGFSDNLYVLLRGQEQPPNDPHVTIEDTILENGKMKRVTYEYDAFNNVTLQKEYDFGGTNGSLGPLVRQTVRIYGTSQGSNFGIVINGVCYSNLNPLDSTCGNGLASDITSIIYQPRLLWKETIKDENNNQRAYSELEYDKYDTSANHAALAVNSGMIQYDGTQFSLYTSSSQPRGNVTKATQWAGGSTYISKFMRYDNAGNVVGITDPKGYVSTVSFVDDFGDGSNPGQGSGGSFGATFAFPTLTTNALGHQARIQHHFTHGVATGVKDANNVITKTEYDPIGRPTRSTAALNLGSQVISEATYPTATSNVRTLSRQLDSSRWLASKVEMDGFDREVTSWQAEDGQKADVASFTIRRNSIYDSLGRVKQISNPYRPQNESAIYTTTTYDQSSRVTSVTTLDSAVVTTAYDGDRVLVSDQTGRKRVSRTDALGRLRDVWEIKAADEDTVSVQFPNFSGMAGYNTSYDYDVLDNLIKVMQGSQQRFFMYDSLKRLIRARNPEQGTHSSLDLTDPLTGNSSWSFGYSYDENSNLQIKTDARGFSSTYQYDALNRNTTVDYSNTPAYPDVARYYDNSINYGKGRYWYDYFYKDDGTIEHQAVDGYDALGRTWVRRQLFYSAGQWYSYQSTNTYDLAGNLKTQTYPSGHSVTYNYDAAGRLGDKDSLNLAFTGNLGDGTQRTYAQSIAYTSGSQMQEERFGTTTPLYHKLRYNVRGQLYDVRLSTMSRQVDPMNWNRGCLAFYYSTQGGWVWGGSGSDNNGNILLAQHWMPDNDQVTGYRWMNQYYTYDALNRIESVTEQQNGSTNTGVQSFAYDRYGNRTINTSNTSGFGINNKAFSVDPSTNRLSVPSGQNATMTYDAAGNLTFDSYTGEGTRTYDAENRMTTAWANAQWQSYGYDADGHRTRRKIDGTETWQVYGPSGELMAEYAASAAATNPQKEYGYRNGQLLITASAGQSVNWTNVVGATASGNNLTKTAAAGWGNAGAVSTQSISSGDGFVESLVSQAGTVQMFGLSNGNTNQDYTDIDFSAYLAGSSLCVYENHLSRGCFGSYSTGDTIRVAVESGVVKYKKNGTVFYISSKTPTYPLLVDTAIYSTGNTISNVVLSGNLSGGSGGVQWLVADHLGTPRMIVDQSGSLASMKRHDYLPFGEELFAGVGNRDAAHGYAGGDGIRQQFTAYERDVETSLDYAQARYYQKEQGRFTSPDHLTSSAKEHLPQTWNRYTYGLNNPLIYIDPDGLEWRQNDKTGHVKWYYKDDDRTGTTEYIQTEYPIGNDQYVRLDPNGPNSEALTQDGRRGWIIFTQASMSANDGPALGDPTPCDCCQCTTYQRWEYTSLSDYLRTPDGISVSYSALTTGNTFTLDARGNLYTDLEFLPRKPIGNTDANSSVRNFMRLGANVSLVWLNQLVTPTGQEMNSFFTGPAITLSGGAKGFGGGITYSPGNGTATNVGAYTPGGGVTGSGSFKVAETPLKWRK